MAFVTGTLNDFGLAVLAPYSPEITFTPSGPAVNASRLLASRPITVVPPYDGTFSVSLATTDDLRPEAWYTVSIRWLDSAGAYVSADFPDWKLYVPAAGGALTDLLAAPWNPAVAWAGPTAPPGVPTANTFWLNTTTGDFARWAA